MGKRQASARRFLRFRAAHVGARFARSLHPGHAPPPRRPGPTKAKQARASQGGRACRMDGA